MAMSAPRDLTNCEEVSEESCCYESQWGDIRRSYAGCRWWRPCILTCVSCCQLAICQAIYFCTRVHLQLGVLDSQATSSSATTVDKDPLVALALTGERQGELLVERHAHGDNANAGSGSLLGGKVLRNLVRGALLDNGVLGKAAAVEVVGIGTVRETSDSVAGLVTLGALGADFDDSAAEVATDGGAGGCQVVDVLPGLLSAILFCQ